MYIYLTWNKLTGHFGQTDVAESKVSGQLVILRASHYDGVPGTGSDHLQDAREKNRSAIVRYPLVANDPKRKPRDVWRTLLGDNQVQSPVGRELSAGDCAKAPVSLLNFLDGKHVWVVLPARL